MPLTLSSSEALSESREEVFHEFHSPSRVVVLSFPFQKEQRVKFATLNQCGISEISSVILRFNVPSINPVYRSKQYGCRLNFTGLLSGGDWQICGDSGQTLSLKQPPLIQHFVCDIREQRISSDIF